MGWWSNRNVEGMIHRLGADARAGKLELAKDAPAGSGTLSVA
jgi:hypothetical protein